MPLYRWEIIRRKKPLIGPQLHDVSQVLYLPFDLDDGSYVRDRSGYSNHGTIYGATRVAGKIGGALGYDGVDDYVEISHSNVFNLTNVSLVAWIYIDSFPNDYPQIVTKLDPSVWTGYGLCLVKATSKIRFDMGDGAPQYLDSVSTLTTGRWYHVVGTYDGFEQKIYINGALDVSEPKAITIAPNTHPIRVGCQAIALTYWFDGIVDEVRIYNRALSLSEIKRLMDLRGV